MPGTAAPQSLRCDIQRNPTIVLTVDRNMVANGGERGGMWNPERRNGFGLQLATFVELKLEIRFHPV
jgi:hypothetical protein